MNFVGSQYSLRLTLKGKSGLKNNASEMKDNFNCDNGDEFVLKQLDSFDDLYSESVKAIMDDTASLSQSPSQFCSMNHMHRVHVQLVCRRWDHRVSFHRLPRFCVCH